MTESDTPLPLVRVFRTDPGDRVVIQHPDRLSHTTAERIVAVVAERTGVDPDRILLLDGGASVAVLGAIRPERESELLAANTRTWNRNVALSAALVEAARTFRGYEELHTAKGTDEGMAKAASNRRMAEALEAVLDANAAPAVVPMGKVGAGDGDTRYAREVWPHEDRVGPPPVVTVDVKEAGPVAAGGVSLVGAYMRQRRGEDGPDYVPPVVSEESVAAVLRDFVAFAADQLKAKVRGMAVDVEPCKGGHLRLVEPEGADA